MRPEPACKLIVSWPPSGSAAIGMASFFRQYFKLVPRVHGETGHGAGRGVATAMIRGRPSEGCRGEFSMTNDRHGVLTPGPDWPHGLSGSGETTSFQRRLRSRAGREGPRLERCQPSLARCSRLGRTDVRGRSPGSSRPRYRSGGPPAGRRCSSEPSGTARRPAAAGRRRDRRSSSCGRRRRAATGSRA